MLIKHLNKETYVIKIVKRKVGGKGYLGERGNMAKKFIYGRQKSRRYFNKLVRKILA